MYLLRFLKERNKKKEVAARESSYLPRAYAGGYGTSTVVQDYATGELYPFFGHYARTIVRKWADTFPKRLDALCRFQPA